MSLLARLIEAGTPADLVAEVALEIARAQAAREAIESRDTSSRNRTAKYRQRRAISDLEWADLTAQVIERDGWICSYCDLDISKSDVRHAIDHVFPLSKGGTNELDNLCMSCQPCNSSKGDKILDDEWRPPNDDFIRWSGGLIN